MSLGVTVHWAEVYLRILEEHFARGHTGTKQQEIAHSSCCYWRVLVVRPYSVSM